MATMIIVAAIAIGAMAFAVAGIRKAIADRCRPVRDDPAYDTRRPHLER